MQIDKDPDITIPWNFFLLGKVIPKEWGEKHWGTWPYTLQHIYFILSKLINSILTDQIVVDVIGQ